MPLAGAFRKPVYTSKIFVYIDGYNHEDVYGRLFFSNWNTLEAFDSLLDMVMKSETVFDLNACPQSTFSSRTFDGTIKTNSANSKTSTETGENEMEKSEIGVIDHEKKASFIIHVKYRQNATWQGEIKWVNKNKAQYFRSSLEMIKLMDRALLEDLGKEDVEIEWE
jgi:hypothetical protein